MKFLNISVQSVSKWECGDGHPDITLLPSIAAYYSVTIDTLFGISEIEKNKRIEEIANKYFKISNNFQNFSVPTLVNVLLKEQSTKTTHTT